MDPSVIAAQLARLQKQKEREDKEKKENDRALNVGEPVFGGPTVPSLGGLSGTGSVTSTKITKGVGNGIAGFAAKKKSPSDNKKKINEKCLRVAGDGSVWEDSTMAEWADNDFRVCYLLLNTINW